MGCALSRNFYRSSNGALRTLPQFVSRITRAFSRLQTYEYCYRGRLRDKLGLYRVNAARRRGRPPPRFVSRDCAVYLAVTRS